MHNLTVDGCVIGRQLDPIFAKQERRIDNYGSIIVVIGTDAPLMSSQLSRIAKRAALGVGRVGTFASSTSGEIMIAFSTGNRIYRDEFTKNRLLNIRFVNQHFINPLYEAAIEATEEAILNAIFCSAGMNGKQGIISPALPAEKVVEAIKKIKQSF